MKIRLGTLRRIIREVSGRWPGAPLEHEQSDINTREQLASLKDTPVDTQDDADELPEHLREPELTPEECYGPVPPDQENPYVTQDPFATDIGAQPFSGRR